MTELEIGGLELGRIHRRSNDRKYHSHFTGFLEGIMSSGYIEAGEVEPLLSECEEFVRSVSDGDALDIIEDFHADCLETQSLRDAVDIRIGEIDPECKKSELNRFLGFCRGVFCDGVITLEEAQDIIRRIDGSPSLAGTVGVRQIYVSCTDAVLDGIVDANESLEICDAIGRVVGDCYADTGISQATGVANIDEYRFQNVHSEIDGARIVLTGIFQTSPRRLLEEELAAHGAIIGRAVSGRTDFVLVGGEASRDWIELNRGTKIRKAQELRSRSERPRFVSELQLLRVMSS